LAVEGGVSRGKGQSFIMKKTPMNQKEKWGGEKCLAQSQGSFAIDDVMIGNIAKRNACLDEGGSPKKLRRDREDGYN